jgi:hypothetical protein
MPPKRKAAQAIEAAPTHESSTTAGLANILRSKLIDIATKHRRTAAQHTIAVEALNCTLDESLFFNKLPRELRDEVYKHLWSDSPRLRQRYGRSTYTVSYGNAPSLSRAEHPKVQMMVDSTIQCCHDGTADFMAASEQADVPRRTCWVPPTLRLALHDAQSRRRKEQQLDLSAHHTRPGSQAGSACRATGVL